MTCRTDEALAENHLGWCLDLVAEHYRNETGKPVNGWQEKTGGSLNDQARARGLQARTRHAGLAELPSLRLPALVCLRGGRAMVMVAHAGHGAMFVCAPGAPAERIGWDALIPAFEGRVVELAPDRQAHRGRNPRVPITKLTGDLGDLTHPALRIAVLAAALELCLIAAPLFMKLVLDRVLPVSDGPLLATSGAFFIALAGLQMLLLDARGQALIRFSQEVNLKWLTNLFTHLVRLPIGFFEQRTVGDVASKFWSVAHLQRTLTAGFIEGALDGLMALVTLLVMVFIGGWLSVLPLFALAVYLVIRWRGLSRQQSAEHERTRYSVVQQSHIWETISGIQSIKLFERESIRLEGWLGHITRMFHGDGQYQQVDAGLRTAASTLISAERVIVITLGAWLTMHQTLTIAQLIVFLTYNELFLNRSTTLTNKLAEIALLNGHRDKIAEIALHEPEPVRGSGPPLDIGGDAAGIEFRNVHFKHPGSEFPLLKDFSLTIRPGQCIAFTGPSGCGKTTLLRLMLGLAVPQNGQILVGGCDLHDLPPADYRRHLATVMQEDRLFTGSVLENITFFDRFYDMDFVTEVARIVDIHDDITNFPSGFHTQITDTGSILSSGQRQRLLLARALYRRPKFLFLDEATSHLDPSRERKFTELLASMEMTRIIVSHHPRPLAAADRVFRHCGCGFVEITDPTPALV